MRIQVITNDNNKEKWGTEYVYVFSKISEPQDLELFDVNFIDLQCDSIWVSKYELSESINSSKDFASLKTLLSSSKKARNIVLFPDNYDFQYCEKNGIYQRSVKIKDCLPSVRNIVCSLFPTNWTNYCSMCFEKSVTTVGVEKYESSFSFSRGSSIGLTFTDGSKLPTTLKLGNCILSSLFLKGKIKNYLYAVGVEKEITEYPEWMKKYIFFDDQQLNETIKQKQETIEQLQAEVNIANAKLKKNNFYKSILISNGAQLVETVFDILQQILNCDLSTFVDEKKEDFLIKKDNVTFIGEIKGITSNVKSEHVSQLDVHCQEYRDNLDKKNIQENIKGLLIINPLRNAPLSEREKVHDFQINLAKRNNSLIITTDELLKLFEKYLDGMVNVNIIIHNFSTKSGLFSCEEL